MKDRERERERQRGGAREEREERGAAQAKLLQSEMPRIVNYILLTYLSIINDGNTCVPRPRARPSFHH